MAKEKKDKKQTKAERKAQKLLKKRKILLDGAFFAGKIAMMSAKDRLLKDGWSAEYIHLVMDPNPPGDNVLWTGDIYVGTEQSKRRVFNVIGAFHPAESEDDSDDVGVYPKWFSPANPKREELN